MNTFALSTLGCKVNQYETQALREQFQALGWRERPFRAGADVCVINTCVVTAEAEEKCRKEARRARRANPAARVFLTGCAARADAERWRRIPGVAGVFTREQMVNLADVLQEGAPPPEGDIFRWSIRRFEGRTRAFLKIQDGCDAGCAYCIVPQARGPVRSRPLADIRAEAARLTSAGHVEIVLTGIHLGHYGRGLHPRVTPADAARAVLAAPGLLRLRLSSIEALELSDELLTLAAGGGEDRDDAGAPALCPHFHLPLQSGDDAVLRAMNRRYTAAQYLDVLDRARRRLDRPSFTTDVMVGFPGETEAAFENTLLLCRRAGFSRIHIFPFSPRPGTPAAERPGRVAPEVLRGRVGRLKTLADALARDYRRQFLGEVVHPLIEHRRDRATRLLTGWTARYVKTIVAGPDEWKGRLQPVRVSDLRAGGFLGVALPPK